MCINYIKNWKVPSPKRVKQVNINQLRDAIAKEFNVDIPILIPDKYWYLATMDSFLEFLDYDQTDKYVYIADKENKEITFDCDNYAHIFKGNASIPKWGNIPIGTVWLSEPKHAINIFVDEKLIPYYVEPQNDSIWKVSDKPNWKPYIVWF